MISWRPLRICRVLGSGRRRRRCRRRCRRLLGDVAVKSPREEVAQVRVVRSGPAVEGRRRGRRAVLQANSLLCERERYCETLDNGKSPCVE